MSIYKSDSYSAAATSRQNMPTLEAFDAGSARVVHSSTKPNQANQTRQSVKPKTDFSPPSSNTGGKSPVSDQLAFIDWLTFTFKFELSPFDFDTRPNETESRSEKLQYISYLLFEVLALPEMALEVSNKGFNGYRYSIKLDQYGTVAWGGENQRGSVCVSLNGQGCSMVKDWLKVKYWIDYYGAKITRCDPAYDDFEGKTVTVEIADQWYDDGKFTNSGRPPNARLVHDKGSAKGKTLYVGDRKSGKLCRVYEKGKQLGDKLSAWVRVEVELHNKDRVIPSEILTNPGFYLASAYPCLEFLSLIQCRIKTIKKAATISYAKMVEWLREAGGKSLNVMMEVNQGDYVSVIDQLIRPGVPRRLEPYANIGFRNLELAA